MIQRKTPLKRTGIKPPSYEEALAKAKAAQERAIKRAKTNKGQAPKVKAAKKPKTKTITVPQLKKKADTAFSIYIRLRDAEFRSGSWWCRCCTCDRWIPLKEIQNGHFQSRRYMNTRYNKLNCSAQCVRCNIFNAGEQYKFALFLDRKHGPGTARSLELLARKTKKFKTWELEDIINECEQYIATRKDNIA